MTKVKRIKVNWEFIFPVDMTDDKVIDNFDKQVIASSSEITHKNIEIVDIDEGK